MKFFFKSLPFKRALRLAIGVFLGVLLVGVAVGIWYGPAFSIVEGTDAPPSFSLKLDGQVTLDKILDELDYKALWITKEKANVDIYVTSNTGKDYADTNGGVLAYDPVRHVFTARGVGEGRVTFSSKIDKAVSLTVPYTIGFDSDGVRALLDAGLGDGILTRDEIESVTSLVADVKSAATNPTSLSDLSKFPNLKTLHLTSPEVTYLSELGAAGELDLFVPAALYSAYMADESWAAYRNFIFPEQKAEGDFSVIYNGNGGTFGAALETSESVYFTKVKNGTIISEQQIPIERIGYTLEGWYQDIDGEDSAETRLGGAHTVNKNLKYHAAWREHQYTLKFNSNGGTGKIEDKTLKYSEEFKPDETVLSMPGYTFGGWTVGSASSTKTYPAGHTYYAETAKDGDVIQLYAKWGVNEYHVVYHDDSGRKLYQVTLDYNEGAVPYNYTATRTGYHFRGWSRQQNSSTAEITTHIRALTAVDGATVDLYPVWEANTYSVNYISAATGATGLPTTSYNIQYGSSFTLPTDVPKIKGRSFLGWHTKNNAEAPAYVAGQSVMNLTDEQYGIVTLYAVWKPETFNVVFNANGAESGSARTVSVEYGDSYPITTALTKTGYYIAGWGLSTSTPLADAFSGIVLTASNIDKLYDKAIATSNRTVQLYPIWAVNTYTLEYIPDNGGDNITKTGLKCNESVTMLGAPTKTGYIFRGWSKSATATTATYTAGQRVSALTDKNDETVRLYAVWEADTFTVAFDGTSTTSTVSYDQYSLTTPSITKADHTLEGWALSANQTVIQYSTVLSSSQIKGLYDIAKTKSGKTVTLYPVWRQNVTTAATE